MSVGELIASPFLKYFILTFFKYVYLVGNLVGAESNSSFLAEPTTTKEEAMEIIGSRATRIFPVMDCFQTHNR